MAYARPSQKSCIGALASSDLSDGLTACMLNPNANKIDILRGQVHQQLRQVSLYPARRDMYAKGYIVLPQKQKALMWMIVCEERT